MPRVNRPVYIKLAASLIVGILLVSGPLRAESAQARINSPGAAAGQVLPAPSPVSTTAPAAVPAPVTDEAERIYKSYGDAIYQVQVIDLASGKKSSIGSGFQFDADGYMATNYHVVAEAIQRPADNRLEYLHEKGDKSEGDQLNGAAGSRGTLTVVMADVVHDIAVLKMDKPGAVSLKLGTSRLPKGARLFSLGNPHDIGFTIIEGTFNGLSKESFIEKIHFSGSLNPGMSGGPALSHKGEVTGINVSTAGNQISFLVPVEYLSALAQQALDADRNQVAGKGEDFVPNAAARIEAQLMALQDKNIDRVLASKWESIPFGAVMVPGRIDDAFRCWGAPAHKDSDPYTYYRSTCAAQESIFMDNDFVTGGMSYRYDLIRAKDSLNLARFYNFYEQQYASPVEDYENAGERDVTNFTCNSRFVTLSGEVWKSAFCVRQYKKYPKLYDLHLYMALLNHGREGLLTSFVAEGVTSQNAVKLADTFMRNIRPVDKAAQAAATVPQVLSPEAAPAAAGAEGIQP